jgi:sphinganine-1-phosphate aldolase
VSFGALDEESLDVFAVADALAARGWYVDRQGPPPSLHCTVNASHSATVDDFIVDLRSVVNETIDGDRHGGSGAYGTVD